MQSVSLFIFVLTVFHFNDITCQLAGGFTDQDPSKYTGDAWKAVPEINEQNNGPYYLIPIKVLKAQTQVVAGLNTVLEVLVGESTCLKHGSVPVSQITSANCSLKPGGQRSLYTVSIWDKPWENFEQIKAEKIRDVGVDETF